MSTVKKEARLSGLLLARKGTAQPAHTDHKLTVQAFDPLEMQQAVRESFHEFEVESSDQSMLVEAVKEINDVTRRQYNNAVKSSGEAKIDKSQEVKVEKKQVVVKKAPVAKTEMKKTAPPVEPKKQVASKRIAMTLRMEQDDHLKLRLYAAHSRKSCQEIISAALDMYLSEDDKVCDLSDCNCLNN